MVRGNSMYNIMTPEIYEALDFLYEFDTYGPYQEALALIANTLEDAAIALWYMEE